MANCETHGHIWNSSGVCIFCQTPKPFRCPHGWQPWDQCPTCSKDESNLTHFKGWVAGPCQNCGKPMSEHTPAEHALLSCQRRAMKVWCVESRPKKSQRWVIWNVSIKRKDAFEQMQLSISYSPNRCFRLRSYVPDASDVTPR